jgi:hypothetical protein
MREFLPREEMRQPRWSSELMQRYWSHAGRKIPERRRQANRTPVWGIKGRPLRVHNAD